jgi:hypothetical protein
VTGRKTVFASVVPMDVEFGEPVHAF